ncbi:MAG: hypothetical protein SV062_08255 [Thermodesulfobacteriota bacterium]|nr:hypothetical protein [Thermodesulfobacteriota bacterium]
MERKELKKMLKKKIRRYKMSKKIECSCGYKGKPRIVYESPYHVWYCPTCDNKQV